MTAGEEKTKTIGITGGVGSGKTAILQHFQGKYHAKIIVADQVAHLLEAPGEPCYNELVEFFGKSILREDGFLDNGAFAQLIFSSPEALQRVNDIVHPEVKKYIMRTIEEEKKKKTPYVVVEAALLLEEGYDRLLDEIWYIYTAEDNRRLRLKQSRGYSDEIIDGIMARQLKETQFREKCKVVIDNNGPLEDTIAQMDAVLHKGEEVT
ncbi:MAG: dephospho-CoA kinase [Lachnospiraceae bacterium]